MGTTEYADRLQRYVDQINQQLDLGIPGETTPYADLLKAMRYSLLAGGKRIRPVLVLEFCRLCGGDVQEALPVACSVEMLHTYSLIHDDLPCMDNDDLRRGKPSNHKVYGECTATLAGDALQAAAFGSILNAPLPDRVVRRCAAILAEAAGVHGICGGQQMDMQWEGKALEADQIMMIHRYKTAALLQAACRMGVAAAEGSDRQMQDAEDYAAALGLAFQLRDDMLDVIGCEAELGKPIGSDRQEGKHTFTEQFGLEGTEKELLRYTKKAKQAVAEWSDNGFLLWLADQMAQRKA